MKISSLTPAMAVSAIVVTLGSTSVFAQSGSGWEAGFPKRFYVGLGGGNARLEPDTAGTSFLPTDNSDKAAVGFAGIDLSRRLSLELQYADLGTALLQNIDTLEQVGITYSETSLSGLFYLWNDYADDDYLDYDGLDLRAGFSFYGRLGAGQMENESIGSVNYTRENDIQLMAGLGIEYSLRNGLAGRLEYTKYDTDAEFTALTVLYRFGGVDEQEIAGVDEPELPVLPAPKPITPLPPPPPPPMPEMEPVLELTEASEAAEVEESAADDSDFDGIANDLDACPDTVAGIPVDAEGCEMFNGVVEGINFLTGSDTLTELARTTLDDVVSTLKEFPGVRLSVQAHTDNQGEEVANLELSRQRALSVVRYLISQGISIDRLQARAYGESRPIADNSTQEGRLINRRVEFQTVQ